MAYLCTFVTTVAGKLFCIRGNVPPESWDLISMKNEFYFKRMVIYTTAMKNYVCHVRLNEGKFQDEISATGIKLNSSVINPTVKTAMMEIIEQDILKTAEINPVLILHKIKAIETTIRTSIRNGDVTFGRKSRFSGETAYKSRSDKDGISGLYANNVGRSCYIWNLLYPQIKINPGDYAYVFSTIIEDETSLIRSHISADDREFIRKTVFNNPAEPHLAKYGMRSIAIPQVEGLIVPSWIIESIDYDSLVDKHLQPIVSLLPSLGLQRSHGYNSKTSKSPLISF
jgi:hypothetical protein